VAYLQDPDGVRVALGASGLTLGRDDSNDVALRQDVRVSRSHAEIVNSDGQWVLVDLGSKNGTFVNTRRVERHPLRDRDQIQIGGSIWLFHFGDDPRATEAATDAGTLAPKLNLTRRELDVLRLVSEGLSDKEIAGNLQISVNTVRSHLDRIGEKTGLRKRSELTRLAIGLHLESEH
jgi:DNA-binding CsgD family transcriptional regulator